MSLTRAEHKELDALINECTMYVQALRERTGRMKDLIAKDGADSQEVERIVSNAIEAASHAR